MEFALVEVRSRTDEDSMEIGVFAKTVSKTEGSRSFTVLPPLSPQIPAPPATPNPYRVLPPIFAGRKTQSFYIVQEANNNDNPCFNSSSCGRVSTFRGYGFKSITLESSHFLTDETHQHAGDAGNDKIKSELKFSAIPKSTRRHWTSSSSSPSNLSQSVKNTCSSTAVSPMATKMGNNAFLKSNISSITPTKRVKSCEDLHLRINNNKKTMENQNGSKTLNKSGTISNIPESVNKNPLRVFSDRISGKAANPKCPQPMSRVKALPQRNFRANPPPPLSSPNKLKKITAAATTRQRAIPFKNNRLKSSILIEKGKISIRTKGGTENGKKNTSKTPILSPSTPTTSQIGKEKKPSTGKGKVNVNRVPSATVGGNTKCATTSARERGKIMENDHDATMIKSTLAENLSSRSTGPCIKIKPFVKLGKEMESDVIAVVADKNLVEDNVEDKSFLAHSDTTMSLPILIGTQKLTDSSATLIRTTTEPALAPLQPNIIPQIRSAINELSSNEGGGSPATKKKIFELTDDDGSVVYESTRKLMDTPCKKEEMLIEENNISKEKKLLAANSAEKVSTPLPSPPPMTVSTEKRPSGPENNERIVNLMNETETKIAQNAKIVISNTSTTRETISEGGIRKSSPSLQHNQKTMETSENKPPVNERLNADQGMNVKMPGEKWQNIKKRLFCIPKFARIHPAADEGMTENAASFTDCSGKLCPKNASRMKDAKNKESDIPKFQGKEKKWKFFERKDGKARSCFRSRGGATWFWKTLKFSRFPEMKCWKKDAAAAAAVPKSTSGPDLQSVRNRRKSSVIVPKKRSPFTDFPKLESSFVEHNSIMRAAIPLLPVPLAWICLWLNIFLPGFGTLASGIFCLIVGKPRFSINDSITSRIGSLVVNVLVAGSQLFTVLFCLVGWGWSIWWGLMMLRMAKRNKRIYMAEHATKIANQMAQNHNNHRDVERGCIINA